MATTIEDLLKNQKLLASPEKRLMNITINEPKTAAPEVARRIPRNIINEQAKIIQLPDANKPKGFVGPKPERVLNPASFDKFLGSKPAFETMLGDNKSLTQKIAGSIPSGVKKVASLAGRAVVPAAILAPAIPAAQTIADKNATRTQKIDAGVTATGEIGGGIVGASLLPKVAKGITTVSRLPLPPQLKIPLMLGGAILGSFAGKAGANQLLAETPDQLPAAQVAQEKQVPQTVQESDDSIQSQLAALRSTVPASGSRSSGFASGPAQVGGNSLLGIANRRIAENANLLSRPGAVEVIRGLQRSAFLGNGVEVSLEPGAEIGRERSGRAFGQPGVASSELKTDAQRDVAAMNLAGRFAAANNKPMTLNQLQGVLANQVLSGDPAQAEEAINQAENLGRLKSALSGKSKKAKSPFDEERKSISEILSDSEASEDDKSLALKRAMQIKMIESFLGE